jgi:hypothetical protein
MSRCPLTIRDGFACARRRKQSRWTCCPPTSRRGRSTEDVREVLLGSRDRVAQLATEPGSLAFFRGRYSMHRVPPVGGSTPRMNSVLTYSVDPGHKLNALAQQLYYGRTA